MVGITEALVDQWLSEFAACVRNRDYDAGRSMFDTRATGFGTVADEYAGLDQLVTSQWSDVWGRTVAFDFDAEDVRWFSGNQCVVATRWRSVGVDTSTRRDRTGRATLVLVVGEDRTVRATHSHFSMSPGTSA